jgi:ABC-type transport system involved in multi-copper enzyme maturation permease subunit
MTSQPTISDVDRLTRRLPLEEVAKPVTLSRVVRSERIKFTTLRSTLIVLAVAAGGMLVIAMLVAYNTRHLSPSLDPNDIVASSTMQGYYLGQLLIGALGVLFVTGEYSTGMIRSTMAAVPRRIPVVWAKLIVFVIATLPLLVVMCLVSFLAAQGLISHYRTGFSLGDPGALRVVIGTGVYLTLIGVIGAALGWIVRSTPGALVSYLATILVIPLIFGAVLGTWGKHVAEYLPSQAGAAFINTIPDGPSLHPWTGLGILMAWVVAFMIAALISVRRRDT